MAFVQKNKVKHVLKIYKGSTVTHIYNPSYLGSESLEDQGSRPAKTKP
jgi:hypothetical protein